MGYSPWGCKRVGHDLATKHHHQQYIYVDPNLPIPLTLPFPSWYPYICSLCLCLYFCFANKIIYTIFSRLHIYALIYYIFLFLTYFTLYNTLDPSTSLQMTQFHSFIRLSNIPLYICKLRWILDRPIFSELNSHSSQQHSHCIRLIKQLLSYSQH